MEQIALVTGSSKGIGKAIAIRLGMEGYIIYVTYLTDKRGGEETINEIVENGGKAHLLELDVRYEDSVKSAFEVVTQHYGHLNVLVNNAGIDIPKNIKEITLEEWGKVVETKINGNFLCTKYGLPLLMYQENANLIIITSTLGEYPKPEYLAYSVGSAGIIAFAKAMALELSKYGIRTNAVCPGTTRTFMQESIRGTNEDVWNNLANNNPMGRLSTPQDIASVVMSIIKDVSRYLNGTVIHVDGGMYLKR